MMEPSDEDRRLFLSAVRRPQRHLKTIKEKKMLAEKRYENCSR